MTNDKAFRNGKAFGKELAAATQIAREAGEIILRYYANGASVQDKEDGTPVTEADIAANTYIVSALHEAFPGDGIVSEEGASVAGTRRWYVDPIDGTKQFIRHNGQFAVHIGFSEEGMPDMGVVYRPTTDELYFATRGGGAYLTTGGTTTRLIKKEEGSLQGLVAVVSNTTKTHERDLYQDILRHAGTDFKVIRSGSEGLRLMEIVRGNANFHFLDSEHCCSTWDACAPHAILAEWGGDLRYDYGMPVRYVGQRKLSSRIIAADSRERIEAILQAKQELWHAREEEKRAYAGKGG